MARVLFLTELLPYPLVSGAKIRAYYVLRHLAQHHQVTLLTFVRGDDRPEDIAHLAGFLEHVYTVPMQRTRLNDVRALLVSLVTGSPAIIAREHCAAMQAQVEQLLADGSFDIVHADQIPMAQYGLLGKRPSVRRLLDQHNATFQLIDRLARNEPSPWKRLLLRREASAFERYERRVCRQFDQVVFVTEEDRKTLEWPDGADAGRIQGSVIPICVDTDAVEPVQSTARPTRITYLGTMYWPPNVEGFEWLYEHVWPEVRRQAPDARLTCIGKRPPARIMALNEEANVDILGYVPDLSPLLAETAVFVVPLRSAGGMRVKILDAWSWALPVVSTTVGGEGIAYRDGDNILIADSEHDFASAVIKVLSDPDHSASLRKAGRRWVEELYDWRQVYAAWDTVYQELLAAGPRSGAAGHNWVQ